MSYADRRSGGGCRGASQFQDVRLSADPTGVYLPAQDTYCGPCRPGGNPWPWVPRPSIYTFTYADFTDAACSRAVSRMGAEELASSDLPLVEGPMTSTAMKAHRSITSLTRKSTSLPCSTEKTPKVSSSIT